MENTERQATEDRIWSEWSAASAQAQNEYHRAWKASHDSFRAGGQYRDLEAGTKAALAARNAAEDAAFAAYRKSMEAAHEP